MPCAAYENEACAVIEIPPWITLNVAWSAAIAGNFEEAARLATRSLKRGEGHRLAEQSADLLRWSQNPTGAFKRYLAIRDIIDLDALATFNADEVHTVVVEPFGPAE